MSLGTGLALTLALLAGNGFFVAAEFALVAAKRPRLEREAAQGSRAARSAVAGIRELSLMLAGAQFGITMCSLGLGVVSEPVFAHTFAPAVHALGLPEAASHVVAFVLALALVTLLHMVLGEMAPKSWAIIRPERSATLMALPFRGFTRIVRPVLALLNGITNLLLRMCRVQPRDSLSVSRTPEQLGSLVEESRRLGLIDETDRRVLKAALAAPREALADLVVPEADIVAVPAEAGPQDVIDAAARTGRTRLLLRGADGRLVPRMVHVRDAYLARARGKLPRAAELAHPVPTLAFDTPVAAAVALLQAGHSAMGLVRDSGSGLVGLITLDDLLTTLLAPG